MSNVPRDSWHEQLSPKARQYLESQGLDVAAPPPARDDALPLPPAPARGPSVKGARRGERRRAPGARRRRQRNYGQPRLARYLARDDRYLQRLRKRLLAQGVKLEPQVGIRPVPRRLWVMARMILADRSGGAVRVFMRRVRDKSFVGALRMAALVPYADGTTRFTWADMRARRIAVHALVAYELAIPTRRKGAWNGLVRGVPQGAWLALLADPFTGERPSRSALAGRHHEGACLETGLGYLRALEAAGAVYAQQCPVDVAEPWEIGPSGYAMNRLWVLSGEMTGVSDDNERAALMALAGDGWLALEERPVRSPGRRQAGAFDPAAAVDLPRAQPP